MTNLENVWNEDPNGILIMQLLQQLSLALALLIKFSLFLTVWNCDMTNHNLRSNPIRRTVRCNKKLKIFPTETNETTYEEEKPVFSAEKADDEFNNKFDDDFGDEFDEDEDK
ncbi:hypothetical protein glysoja_045343 [Glycine soja]|uniref:Uncharacterized protein n=1 Tax=Glycine soja TaxID=3848 RepID=A0A0B2QFW4_GLYSO|nr:hypothetical protein glysoja_045343 [Glycine soja]